MRPLSAPAIVDLWEHTAAQHPLDRAIAMLSTARPELAVEDVAALPIGSRDAFLAEIRELTFGPKAAAVMDCPACSERLEFEVDLRELRAHEVPQPFQVESGAYRFTVRVPDSRDLAAAIGAADGRAALLERCVFESSVALDDLPENVIGEIASRMAERDPQAEVMLRLECPRCGRAVDALFDIASFLWAEIQTEARRLIGQVHELASAYGWREADILAMSARRRQMYLDMVNA
jgi:hypothetical protein